MALSKAKLKVTLRGLLGVTEGADEEVLESMGAGVEALKKKLATATSDECVEASVESLELGIEVDAFIDQFRTSLETTLAAREAERQKVAAEKKAAADKAAAEAAKSKK